MCDAASRFGSTPFRNAGYGRWSPRLARHNWGCNDHPRAITVRTCDHTSEWPTCSKTASTRPMCTRWNFDDREVAKYELRRGDILLNEGQSPELVGRAAIYRDEMPGACFQNHLIRFRAGPDVVPEFALLVFRRYLHSGVFRSIARWSTNIANLGLRRFNALPFPLPPREEQELIAAAARRGLDATANQTSAVLDSLKKVPEMERELLAAAVAGEIVAQIPGEESATALLARLGPPPSPLRQPRGRGRATRMRNRRRSKGRSGEGVVDLAAVPQAVRRPTFVA